MSCDERDPGGVRPAGDGDLGFEHAVHKSGEVVIRRHGVVVTTLRGQAAQRFLTAVERGDPQQAMARATGNYRRGNERPS